MLGEKLSSVSRRIRTVHLRVYFRGPFYPGLSRITGTSTSPVFYRLNYTYVNNTQMFFATRL